MVKVKASSIMNEAKEIKGFVEKNHQLPKTCTLNDGQVFDIYDMSFMMASVLLNTRVELWTFNKDIKKYGVAKYNDKLNNVKVSNSRYMDMVTRFVAYSKKNGRVPSNIIVNGQYGASSFELFTYCLAKILAFFHEKHTLPSYCVFDKADLQGNAKTVTNTKKSATTSTSNSTKKVKLNCENPYTSSPHYLDKGCNQLGQCTGYYCGPHSIHQAIRKFGITKFTEKQIAQWCGTTTRGTDHYGVQTGIAKVGKEAGVKFTVQWKNFSDMGKTDNERFINIAKLLCKSNIAIIWHIAYINGGKSTTGKKFGHYEYIDKINISTEYVRALNSLGDRNSDGSYNGHLQDRPYNVQSYFAKNTTGGQPSLCIITKQ